MRRDFWSVLRDGSTAHVPIPKNMPINRQFSSPSSNSCPKRVPLTVRKTVSRVSKVTKTTTITASIPAKKRALLRARNNNQAVPEIAQDLAEAFEDDDKVESVTLEARGAAASARHNCPVCPASVKLLIAGKNNNVKPRGCCPKRKTVTKSRVVTKTTTVMSTATYCPVGFGGPTCTQCALGSISTGGVNAVCTKCPTGLTNMDQSACLSTCTPIRSRCDVGKVCSTQNDGCGGAIFCGPCPTGQVCAANQTMCMVPSPDKPCTPKTKCSAGRVCGIEADGCGGVIACGNCNSGSLCNGAGTQCTITTPPSCVPDSAPSTCAKAARSCGVTINNCGQSVSCGNCLSNQTCNSAGSCVNNVNNTICIPLNSPPTSNIVCGAYPNGCGGSLIAGICPSGTACAANHTVCEPPQPSCVPRTTCLTQTCGYEGDGCGGFVLCGSCPTNQTCGSTGQCISG